MASNTVYYVPLDDDGAPLSGLPAEARYNDTLRLWLDPTNGFTVSYVGLTEGEDGCYSSRSYDEVQDWIDGALSLDTNQTI